MLISDGHEFHEHYDFIEYCWKYYIIPYPLPPHTAHLMQPLDVACFQPLKYYYRLAIDKAMILGITKFPLMEFFSIYSDIRDMTFINETIISAFKKTGLQFFNLEKVVGPLRARQEVAAVAISAFPLFCTIPFLVFSPSLSLSQYTTPQKISEIDAMRSHTRGLLINAGVDARALAAYDKIMKGAMAGFHAGAQAII